VTNDNSGVLHTPSPNRVQDVSGGQPTQMRSNSLNILTNYWGQNSSSTWKSATTYCPPEGNDLFSSIKLAIRLYMKRTKFNCVVLGMGRSDIIFATMQSLLPFRKVHCIITQCYWNKDPRRFRFLMKKLILKIVNKSVDKFIVLSRREIEAFSKTFNLPKEKFVFVTYHTTIGEHYKIITYEGDYIFSGGNSCRDYETLIEAVRGLSVTVFIASTDPGISPSMSIPENVDIRGYSHEEYIKKLTGCRINVVPLASGLLRSAGQQTFLNAMWLGKPTIVTDIEGASDYINDGEDGFLVPPRDPLALRDAIETLLDHPARRKEIAIKAMQKAKNFSIDEYFKNIVSIANEVVEGAGSTDFGPR